MYHHFNRVTTSFHATFRRCILYFSQIDNNHHRKKCLLNTLLEKSNFCPKNQFWKKTQHFHEFFTQIFFDNFSREIKVVNKTKKSKTTTFSRVFHPQKIDNFLGKSKLNFWTKNEDFEQCGSVKSKLVSNNLLNDKSWILRKLTYNFSLV